MLRLSACGVLLISSALGLALLAVSPSGVRAAEEAPWACDQQNGTHYAGIVTSTTSQRTQCQPINHYGGWNGVRGWIAVPSTEIYLNNPATDHAAAWLGIVYNHSWDPGYNRAWMQAGWITGTLPGLSHPHGYELYVEYQNFALEYHIVDFGPAAPGSSHLFEVSYSPGDHCWHAYVDGQESPLKDCLSSWTSISGMAEATAEMYSDSGTAPPLPLTYFGASNPDSAAALHLHGGLGWVSWNTSLSSGKTQPIDERDHTPGYMVSCYNNYWYFQASRVS
jgi:hypothetical protein